MKITKSFFSVLLLTSFIEGTDENKLNPETSIQEFKPNKSCNLLSKDNPFDPLIDDDKNAVKKEFITFYDQDTDKIKEICPFDLEGKFTSYTLRRLTIDTLKNKKVPSNAGKIFEKLISRHNVNILRLPELLKNHINIVGETENERKYLNTLIIPAFNKSVEEYNIKYKNKEN